MISKESKIFIAGAHGMVGSAITRKLKGEGYFNLLLPKRAELNFLDQIAVRAYMRANLPEIVIVAAAKVGGIFANSCFPAEFLYENLMMECNLIHEAHLANVNRLLFLGSTCIYPKFAPQPIPEEALLEGPLEPTNEAYAVAKIAGVKLTQFYSKQYGRKYSALMPTNLYGPKDNYHRENSHVIAALIRRFHEAKVADQEEVTVWGSGRALREFLYVDDLADALFFLLEDETFLINVGSPDEISIKELAELIGEVIGFKGRLRFDLSKPDGTPRKKSDSRKLAEKGWAAKTPLKEGLKLAYEDFLKNASLT